MESIVCALQQFLFLQISFKRFVVHCQGYSGSLAVKKNHKCGPHAFFGFILQLQQREES